jgi:hypothetical protein
MNIGIVTRSFRGMSTTEVTEIMAKQGFKCTELCFCKTDCEYWKYNDITDISGLTNKRVNDIVNIYRKNNIEVVAGFKKHFLAGVCGKNFIAY